MDLILSAKIHCWTMVNVTTPLVTKQCRNLHANRKHRQRFAGSELNRFNPPCSPQVILSSEIWNEFDWHSYRMGYASNKCHFCQVLAVHTAPLNPSLGSSSTLKSGWWTRVNIRPVLHVSEAWNLPHQQSCQYNEHIEQLKPLGTECVDANRLIIGIRPLC